MNQISEAYPSSSLYGRVNICSCQHFHHWLTGHVKLLLLLRLKTAPAQKNVLQYYFCIIFTFTSKSVRTPGGFGCCSTTQKLLKVLWLLGFDGQGDCHWMEMIQNSFSGAVLVMRTNTVTKTSRQAAGQAGKKARRYAKQTNQRTRFQEQSLPLIYSSLLFSLHSV